MMTTPQPEITISNEFAAVTISVAQSRLGRRLRIKDCATGEERCLDALELEALIWATYEDFDRLLDPSHSRWRLEATPGDLLDEDGPSSDERGCPRGGARHP
jgi:hypothetical protein